MVSVGILSIATRPDASLTASANGSLFQRGFDPACHDVFSTTRRAPLIGLPESISKNSAWIIEPPLRSTPEAEARSSRTRTLAGVFTFDQSTLDASSR